MSRTQLVFNSGDLAFQEITTSRPNRNSATRVVSLDAVWSVTATFPITPLTRVGFHVVIFRLFFARGISLHDCQKPAFHE